MVNNGNDGDCLSSKNCPPAKVRPLPFDPIYIRVCVCVFACLCACGILSFNAALLVHGAGVILSVGARRNDCAIFLYMNVSLNSRGVSRKEETLYIDSF